MRDLYVKQLRLGPMDNFVYLIGAPESPEVAVVDPAWDVGAILRAAEADGKTITHALLTHGHHDHINGVEELLNRTKARVVVQRDELDFFETLRPFASEALPVRGGDVVEVGPLQVKCIHTPGHTPGSQSFHVGDALISGDTLFIHGCGRCDLRGGDAATLYDTLEHTLTRLPDRTLLYPGHDYADRPVAPLREVKQENPYLQVHDPQQFIALRAGPRPKPLPRRDH